MAERNFRFASPGVFIEEIDNSQVPRLPEAVGPTVIGRTEKGPGLLPVKVTSFSDFVETFGEPIPGVGGSDDVWREGNYSAPTYAAYAAQAYLAAGVGPVNVVRLMGAQDPAASTTGKAGWDTTNTVNAGAASNGGAYGLWMLPSGAYSSSVGFETDAGYGITTPTGSLAAIFYVDAGAVRLSGTVTMAGNDPLASPLTAAAGTMIDSDDEGNFTIEVLNSSESIVDKKSFSMNRDSERFIRKVFNTNPQRVNSISVGSTSQEVYWLGETFERMITDNVDSVATKKIGFIASLSDGDVDRADMRGEVTDAYTGWFFAQDAGGAYQSFNPLKQTRLFKFAGINNYGEYLNRAIKVAILDIKGPRSNDSEYGSFTVGIRKATDTDANPEFLELYTNCNLNPNSPDYIANKIGDRYVQFDNDKKLYREYGDYENKSKYVRVVLNPDIEAVIQDNPQLIPFGIIGPPRFKSFNIASGSAIVLASAATGNDGGGAGEAHSKPFIRAGTAIPFHSISHTPSRLSLIDWRVAGATGSFEWPAIATRVSASDSLASVATAYFGVDTGITTSDASFDAGYVDYLRAKPQTIYSNTDSSDFGAGNLGNDYLDFSWAVSLDDIVCTTSSAGLITTAFFQSGSRAAQRSWTSLSGNSSMNAGGTWEQLLDKGINRLVSPMFGGFDGFDVTEPEPFRNTRLDDNSEAEADNYAFYSVKRAIDTIADKERVETNLVTMPGITNESLTSRLINTCEARGDALAIVDLKGTHQPRYEAAASSVSTRASNVDTTISNLVSRNINSSYGCAYYPWVDIRDSLKGVRVRVPPSVVALGVFANTERRNDLWFAPAGFNRGGLTDGAAGLSVTGVEQRLTSDDRDKLYERNINPIASFPAEGIVIFGQKTLQTTPSALDRINVRRMLIFVKHEVTRIANTILFDPNIDITWARFRSRTERLLSSVKSRFGISDFRVVLDRTTTTPDLVDRNILYAKVLVKPTQAIEFIAIDFVVTRTRENFADL